MSLDTVPAARAGEPSGVSATAEQGGGALGIAVLYAIFHSVFVGRLYEQVDRSALPDLTDAQYAQAKADIVAAEQTGLHPGLIDDWLRAYLRIYRESAADGYAAAFAAVALIAAAGAVVTAVLVRRPPPAA